MPLPQGGDAPALPNFWVPFYTPSTYTSAHTLYCRTTRFDAVTHMGRGLVFRGQPRHQPKGVGPRTLQFWGFPSIYAHTLCYRTIYQIWGGN